MKTTNINYKSACLFGCWILSTVVAGAALTSFHQPFRSPDPAIVSIAGEPLHSGWRVIHILSGSCACSQRIMRHLLARPTLPDAVEQVVLVDGEESYLDGSRELVERLPAQGYAVGHRLTREIPAQLGLRGVPLLIIVSPEGKVLYLGGYGPHEDQEKRLLDEVRSTGAAERLPVVGCAVGEAVRRSADPFRLKY